MHNSGQFQVVLLDLPAALPVKQVLPRVSLRRSRSRRYQNCVDHTVENGSAAVDRPWGQREGGSGLVRDGSSGAEVGLHGL